MVSLIQMVGAQRFLTTEPNYILHLIDKSGGIERINSDAENLFDISNSTSKQWIVYAQESDKDKFPHLLSYARFIAISSTPHLPKHIKVTYGYRFMPGVFVIFDQRDSGEDFSLKDPNLVRVVDNIYWHRHGG